MSEPAVSVPSVGLGRAVEGWGVLAHAVDLARSGEPFVLATVVWREGPSSGQQGSRAIWTASGTMYGWIGGACAEPVFVREARAALASGEPRLLVLGDRARFGGLPQGTEAVAMSCQSEGALQIYLEPVVAVPHLVIVGTSPMAKTLSVLADQLDWRTELVSGADFSEGLLSAQSMVVVATQGHRDEEVLMAALKAEPAYVGLVASARRGASVRAFLSASGVEGARLDGLRVPAGLDLGSTTHKEVAVSILAELVQLRAAGKIAGALSAAPVVETAVDPICGMTVECVPGGISLEIGGDGDGEEDRFWFCCVGCRTAFAREQGVG